MAAIISTRARTVAVALAAAVLVLALGLSPQASASTRGPLCAHSPARHSKHGARSCAGARTGRSHGRGEKSHTPPRTGGHHSNRPVRQPASTEGNEGEQDVEEVGEEEADEQESSSGAAETLE